MRLGDLAPDHLSRALAHGLVFHCGPVVIRLRTRLPIMRQAVAALYADAPVAGPEAFVDYDLEMRPRRRLVRPTAAFCMDGRAPLEPLPVSQAPALFEWGLNWAVVETCQEKLIFHAAVLARDGRAILLPGLPGAGKSTLTVALVAAGWKLLSDELALVDTATGLVTGLPRPVSLKGPSIAIAGRLLPQGTFGPRIPETSKGPMCHLRVPAALTQAEPALPARVVFPCFTQGAAPERLPLSKGRAFMRLAEQSFTYHALGRTGFEATARLIDGCDTEELVFGDAAAAAEMLSARPMPAEAVA